MVNNKKVLVAMSGGVDSSVAAQLLLKQGFFVAGAFMELLPSAKKGNALKVAKKLKIPFYTFNFKKEFKKEIVDYSLKEIKRGVTPNPCVVCNKKIKFGLFLKKAKELGFDFVATGHYAKSENGIIKRSKSSKDQSYFLWQLKQPEIKKIIFPLADLSKEQVEKMAVFRAKESMDICFASNKYLKRKVGDIKDMSGDILGHHNGAFNYTIGQRKGLNLSGGPYFVVSKDIKKNILVVTKNEKDLYKKEVKLKNINWVSQKKEFVDVQIRFNQKPVKARVVGNKIIFSKPQKAVTPGQSAVFYSKDYLLGGGIML
ncbi:MAG TPA: tRNA 2-thiouridine(34) synthase MnmA [Candidatus Pacearchaeota archaeon]|nr:tRNA 2-thiouridine(34) synthase MnmA [Candidatus Pacearchaeota archaeon]